MVEFKAWVKPEEMICQRRQLASSDTSSWVCASPVYGNWHIDQPFMPHPAHRNSSWSNNGWISRWVSGYKPWRIWFVVVSPTSCFCPVRQRLGSGRSDQRQSRIKLGCSFYKPKNKIFGVIKYVYVSLTSADSGTDRLLRPWGRGRGAVVLVGGVKLWNMHFFGGG